jgi:hypothetical protein
MLYYHLVSLSCCSFPFLILLVAAQTKLELSELTVAAPQNPYKPPKSCHQTPSARQELLLPLLPLGAGREHILGGRKGRSCKWSVALGAAAHQQGSKARSNSVADPTRRQPTAILRCRPVFSLLAHSLRSGSDLGSPRSRAIAVLPPPFVVSAASSCDQKSAQPRDKRSSVDDRSVRRRRREDGRRFVR